MQRRLGRHHGEGDRKKPALPTGQAPCGPAADHEWDGKSPPGYRGVRHRDVPQGGEQHADGREHRGSRRAETPPSTHGGSSLQSRRPVRGEYEKFPDSRLDQLTVIHVTSAPWELRTGCVRLPPREGASVTTGQTERTGRGRAAGTGDRGGHGKSTDHAAGLCHDLLDDAVVLLGALGLRLVASLGVSPTVLGPTTTWSRAGRTAASAHRRPSSMLVKAGRAPVTSFFGRTGAGAGVDHGLDRLSRRRRHDHHVATEPAYQWPAEAPRGQGAAVR